MRATRLGATVLAALAVLAISASAAQAASFTAAEYPAFVSGEPAAAGSPSFEFEGGQTAGCAFAGLGGEITEASAELKLDPGFFGCTAFGGEASVEIGECELAFHPGTGSGDEYTGSFDVVCPEGEAITISGSGCKVQIGAQTGLGPVGYETLTTVEPNEVEASFAMEAASGFTYTKAEDSGSCPLSGVGVKSDGVVGGSLKLKAGNQSTLEPIRFGIE